MAEVFARTPLIGDLRPGGKYLAKDVYENGGVSVIIRALIESGHMHDVPTVTGRMLGAEHGGAGAPTARWCARSATRCGPTAGSRC